MIATAIRREGGPVMPVRCPVCDKLVGSVYHDGLTLRAFAVHCTPRCEALWPHGRGRGGWRELPPDWRQVQLATWMVDHAPR